MRLNTIALARRYIFSTDEGIDITVVCTLALSSNLHEGREKIYHASIQQYFPFFSPYSVSSISIVLFENDLSAGERRSKEKESKSYKGVKYEGNKI